MYQNIVEVFETEDVTTCNMFLEKGWVLLLAYQNTEEDFDLLRSFTVYVLGRPFSVAKN